MGGVACGTSAPVYTTRTRERGPDEWWTARDLKGSRGLGRSAGGASSVLVVALRRERHLFWAPSPGLCWPSNRRLGNYSTRRCRAPDRPVGHRDRPGQPPDELRFETSTRRSLELLWNVAGVDVLLGSGAFSVRPRGYRALRAGTSSSASRDFTDRQEELGPLRERWVAIAVVVCASEFLRSQRREAAIQGPRGGEPRERAPPDRPRGHPKAAAATALGHAA